MECDLLVDFPIVYSNFEGIISDFNKSHNIIDNLHWFLMVVKTSQQLHQLCKSKVGLPLLVFIHDMLILIKTVKEVGRQGPDRVKVHACNSACGIIIGVVCGVLNYPRMIQSDNHNLPSWGWKEVKRQRSRKFTHETYKGHVWFVLYKNKYLCNVRCLSSIVGDALV